MPKSFFAILEQSECLGQRLNENSYSTNVLDGLLPRCARLGKTVLQVSRLRFGCYRVDEVTVEHASALRLALRVLLNTEGIDAVLLGMRRTPYLEDLLQALLMPSIANIIRAYRVWKN